MSSVLEELSARAKALPVEDRARLAEELLDSLQAAAAALPHPEGADDAADAEQWGREITRRVAEIESGAVTLVAADEVHAQARALIRR
jgi:putative addiction module component (TIGR02574 family)